MRGEESKGKRKGEREKLNARRRQGGDMRRRRGKGKMEIEE